jgi:hypothetical protein
MRHAGEFNAFLRYGIALVSGDSLWRRLALPPWVIVTGTESLAGLGIDHKTIERSLLEAGASGCSERPVGCCE